MKFICFTLIAIMLALQAIGERGEVTFSDVTLLCTQKHAYSNTLNGDGSLERESIAIAMLEGHIHYVFDVDKEACKIRQFNTHRRTQFNEYPFEQSGNNFIGRYEFSDGPGGMGVLLNLDELTYHTRQDFGGRTGAYITHDWTGNCEIVTKFSDLPPTRAMSAGIPDDEIEAYYAELDAEIEAWTAEMEAAESEKQSGRKESMEN